MRDRKQSRLRLLTKRYIPDPWFLDEKAPITLEMLQLPRPNNWPSQLSFQKAQVLGKIELLGFLVFFFLAFGFVFFFLRQGFSV